MEKEAILIFLIFCGLLVVKKLLDFENLFYLLWLSDSKETT